MKQRTPIFYIILLLFCIFSFPATLKAKDSSEKNKIDRYINADGENPYRQYTRCLIVYIKRDYTTHSVIKECLNLGIKYCKNIGLETEQDFTISPVTGKILIDNPRCADQLQSAYNVIFNAYLNELEAYSQAESYGGVYTPVIIDLKAIP